MKTKALLLIVVIFTARGCLKAQNLITNGSAESAPEGNGWTPLDKGSDCYTGSNWHILGNQNDFPSAQSGLYIFFSGCGYVDGELYQDIDVSSFATAIDAEEQIFTFSGYTRSFEGFDGAQIIVEYRNLAGTALYTFDTGIQTNFQNWLQHIDTHLAPANTRTIRVILKSHAVSGSSVDGYFDNLTLVAGSTLPVKLKSFTGKRSQDKILLEWITEAELNNARFLVEESVDGEAFQVIGSIAGQGTSNSAHAYTYKIDNPHKGRIYFRLKQIDLDGRYEYSDVININALPELAQVGDLYPSPSESGIVHLAYTTQQSGNVRIDVIDMKGQLILNQTQAVGEGVNDLTFDFSGIVPGIYVVSLVDGFRTINRKLIISK